MGDRHVPSPARPARRRPRRLHRLLLQALRHRTCQAPPRLRQLRRHRTPLKLVLIEGEPGDDTRLDHLGVEVATTQDVAAATGRLKDAGLATFEENDTSCCYALQDKVWVTGPGKEPWEVYAVKADADTLEKGSTAPASCCGTGGTAAVAQTDTTAVSGCCGG